METENVDLEKVLTEKQKRMFYVKDRNKNAGSCQTCGSWSERLYPDLLSVCESCLKKLRNRGEIRVIRIEKGFRKTCDWCNSFSGTGRLSGTYFIINPMICINCMKRAANKDTKMRYIKEREKVKRRANRNLQRLIIRRR